MQDFAGSTAVHLIGATGAFAALLHLGPRRGKYGPDGKPRAISGPRDAIAAGIGMVHQHFMLVPVFTVAENVILGDEAQLGTARGPLNVLDHRTARRKVREISERFGLPVDPDARIEDLPVGVQQRVEIVKALVRDAQTLILDEPTAVLTPQEIEDLFKVMDSLRKAGKSVELVTLDGEDHWLSSSKTRLQMLTSLVAFLEKHNPPDAPASGGPSPVSPRS